MFSTAAGTLLLSVLVSSACVQGLASVASAARSSHRLQSEMNQNGRQLVGKGGGKKSKEGFCRYSDDENSAIGEMLFSPRSEIDTYVQPNGRAIKDLRDFLKDVRNFIDDDDLSSSITDKDILLLAMLPNLGQTSGNRRLQAAVCESDVITARIIDLIVEVYDLSFAMVGLSGPFGGLGKVVGRSIARKITSGPRGREFVNKIAETISKTGKSPSGIGDVFSSTIAEVGLNGILDAISEAPDVSAWDLAVTGLSFAANLLAVGLSGGAVLALKITQAGLAALDVFNAMDALTEAIEVECTEEPTHAPSARPTPQPSTAEPTPPPSPQPTPQPTTNQPTPQPTTPVPTPSPTRPTNPSGNGRTSGVFGDPHLSTFDRLRFDCQAAGEFTMVTSLETPNFLIQERFVSVASDQCSQASVSTGIAVDEPGIPKIQMSIPREENAVGSGTIRVGGQDCPVDLFVDEVAESSLDVDTGSLQVVVAVIGTTVRVFFPFTGVQVRGRVQYSALFGCHFTAQVFLPFDYRSNETILGLLGTPNSDRSDDWIRADGTPYGVPNNLADSIFSPSYNYCTSQWCVTTAPNSIFTYRAGESFDTFNQCNVTYSSEIETAIQDAIDRDDPIVGVCGSENLVCLVDGLCGDVADAEAFLEEEAEVVAAQQESDPTNAPSAEPSSEPSYQPSVSNFPSSSPMGKGKGKGKGGGTNRNRRNNRHHRG